jgi:hypothetical protein
MALHHSSQRPPPFPRTCDIRVDTLSTMRSARQMVKCVFCSTLSALQLFSPLLCSLVVFGAVFFLASEARHCKSEVRNSKMGVVQHADAALSRLTICRLNVGGLSGRMECLRCGASCAAALRRSCEQKKTDHLRQLRGGCNVLPGWMSFFGSFWTRY